MILRYFAFLRLTVPSTPVILSLVEIESGCKNAPLLDIEERGVAIERHLFQNREIVIAGDTIIEKLEHGHGRRTTIQRIASQLLNALGAEIPCDLGCPAA